MKNFMDRLTSWRIPGNVVSVCINNKEIFSYQSGYENIEKKIPMTNDKLFNIFSCSKLVTVVAALQLYERGYYLLDDPLSEYIPEFRRMYVKDKDVTPAKNPITLRHLFTMTSGINYDTSSPAIQKAQKLTNGKMDTLTVVKCIASEPLSFEPGTNWLYGLNHDILAAVVEIVSNKRFCDYVKENIFEPLEMNNSYYHNEEVEDRVAQLYRYKNNTDTDLVTLQSQKYNNTGHIINVGKKVDLVLGPEYDSGGAGITSSISDYSKFASSLANGGVGQNGERIISSSTIDLLRTNQLNDEQSKGFNWEHHKGYGYGLGVRTLTDIAKSGCWGNIGEFGWGGAAGATVIIDPKLKLSMFYSHHMLNPHEDYYQPRLRNVLYTCLNR